MYTIFIPKYQKDTVEYLTTKTIHCFVSHSSCNCIISSPGYMSTTSNTIKLFIDNFGSKTINNPNMMMGLLNGMNGNTHVYNQSNTIREEHEVQIKTSGTLKLLNIKCHPFVDHRKMMFFIKLKGAVSNTLNSGNFSSFINACQVQGVMIGSSNQSLSTYYGGAKSSPADKGEADILMYIDNPQETITTAFREVQVQNVNIRISKSVDENFHPSDYESMYFREILSDFLENNLSSN